MLRPSISKRVFLRGLHNLFVRLHTIRRTIGTLAMGLYVLTPLLVRAPKTAYAPGSAQCLDHIYGDGHDSPLNRTGHTCSQNLIEFMIRRKAVNVTKLANEANVDLQQKRFPTKA